MISLASDANKAGDKETFVRNCKSLFPVALIDWLGTEPVYLYMFPPNPIILEGRSVIYACNIQIVSDPQDIY